MTREEKRIRTHLVKRADRNLLFYYKEYGESSPFKAKQIFVGLHLLLFKHPNFLSNDKINLSLNLSLYLFIGNLPYLFTLSQPTNLSFSPTDS